MVIWPRGAAHFYGNRKQRWSHSWVHCDGRAVGEALEISPNACRCPLVLFNPSRIERYLWDLNEEIQGPRPAEPVIVRHTLLNIIFEAARLPGTHPHRVAPELLHIRNVMDVRYDEKLDLTLLAREIHWSAPHLCSEFRRCFGVPPITYLIHRRLEAAASMLRNTPLSIGEVGRRVGYDDVYHFSKSFKQFHGQPPTRYRTQVMNPKTEARGAV
jgi:AraC-like DNA-binding protein